MHGILKNVPRELAESNRLTDLRGELMRGVTTPFILGDEAPWD